MSLSAQGFNAQNITLKTAGNISAGYPVQLSSSYTVTSASVDSQFCGVVAKVKDDLASVQVTGFVTLPYTDTAPTVGYCNLVSNGNGGVKVDNTNGKSYLTLTVDKINKTVGIIL